ncbi:MAG: hypothetical protein DI528_09190 [Shinella sp.]|nr:MAG: hypothetical protein DI528_09190 [Shinella sp.]
MISDWNDLQTVLAIWEEGSLSGAARALGVNQSTVSRRLRSIETSLDRPLFHRLDDGKLDAGEEARQLIGAARRIRDIVQEANDVMGGRPVPLRMASCEVLSRTHAAPLLARWSEKTGQPGELSVYDTLFELPKDSFDVMVTPLESAPNDMIGRRIDVLQWNLYASDAYLKLYPFNPGGNSLESHLVIHPAGSLAEVAAYCWLRELGGRVVFSASSPLLQRDAAEAGSGIALLPDAIVPQQTALRRLSTESLPPKTEIWMIARKDARIRRSVSTFLEWVHGEDR